MMQSPQLIHALARQSDRIAPPRTAIETLREPAPARRPAHAAEPRTAWFWQLLSRRGTAAS